MMHRTSSPYSCHLVCLISSCSIAHRSSWTCLSHRYKMTRTGTWGAMRHRSCWYENNCKHINSHTECLSPHRLLCCQSAIISWLLSSTNPPRVYHWYAPAPPGSRGGIIVCTQTGCVNATSSDHPCWHRSGHMLVSNNQNMGMFEIVTLTRRCRLVKFLIMHSPRRILVVPLCRVCHSSALMSICWYSAQFTKLCGLN